jgi:hypothetical protein
MNCCLCDLEIEGHGHNPDPVSREKDARCCDVCNATVVLPMRLQETLWLNPPRQKEEES